MSKMKLTKEKLKQIIREELQEIHSPQQAWSSSEEAPPMEDSPQDASIEALARVYPRLIRSLTNRGPLYIAKLVERIQGGTDGPTALLEELERLS